MKSNFEYGNIIIFSYAIVFVILSVLNLVGCIDGSTILVFSIDAFLLAVVQFLDGIISIFNILYTKMIRTLICLLNGWYLENQNLNKDIFEKKRKEFVDNKNEIRSAFDTRIKLMSQIGKIILSISIIFTIIALSTKFVTENSKVSDSLSLFSFAIVLMEISINTFASKYIASIEEIINETERKISIIFDEKDVNI